MKRIFVAVLLFGLVSPAMAQTMTTTSAKLFGENGRVIVTVRPDGGKLTTTITRQPDGGYKVVRTFEPAKR